jgi:hypothetical protein
MISRFLHDLTLSRNQQPKSADDWYTGILNKKKQFTFKATLRRVGVTILALKKQ